MCKAVLSSSDLIHSVLSTSDLSQMLMSNWEFDHTIFLGEMSLFLWLPRFHYTIVWRDVTFPSKQLHHTNNHQKVQLSISVGTNMKYSNECSCWKKILQQFTISQKIWHQCILLDPAAVSAKFMRFSIEQCLGKHCPLKAYEIQHFSDSYSLRGLKLHIVSNTEASTLK